MPILWENIQLLHHIAQGMGGTKFDAARATGEYLSENIDFNEAMLMTKEDVIKRSEKE